MFLQAAYFSLSSAEDGLAALIMQMCTLPVGYSLRSAFLFLALGVGNKFRLHPLVDLCLWITFGIYSTLVCCIIV